MKERKIIVNMLSILQLTIPFLYIDIRFHKWFPYNLTGPQFLQFYWLLCTCAFVAKFLHTNVMVQSRITILVLAIAVLRMIQGIGNHKPITYLFLSVLLFIMLSGIISLIKQSNYRST